jgi:hypothetical protein
MLLQRKKERTEKKHSWHELQENGFFDRAYC